VCLLENVTCFPNSSTRHDDYKHVTGLSTSSTRQLGGWHFILKFDRSRTKFVRAGVRPRVFSVTDFI
jgi:hypothetical protein